MNTRYLLLTFLAAILSLSASAQRYKTAADTVRLNKEYAKVKADIASLTTDLDKAQGKIDSYRNKSIEAERDAKSAAETSSDRARRARGGDIGDTRRAEKQAKKAHKRAKQSRSAHKDLQGQEKKIGKLKEKIADRHERLQELETMRSELQIRFPAPAPTIAPADR